MTVDAVATRDVYTEAGDLRGVWTRGEEPKELVLSDGSRLTLSGGEQGSVLWRRTDAGEGGDRTISFEQAIELAGEEYSDYVRVRTRAEAGWLRAVADWYGTEAARLERESEGRRTAT
ncbi:MAG TPA: hypothetical protein VFY99_04160 [Solirubrobacterales bacterium]